jgi:hypothetical protein
MKAVYGLYPSPESAQDAVDELQRCGVPNKSITVIASQPHEGFPFSERHRPTWIYWLAAGGGVIGLAAALMLTYVTFTRWPMNVGGMPVFAWFPTVIITFELAMLGAILTAVASLFVTARLPALKPRVYDPAVADGKIMVVVERSLESQADVIERVLNRSL